MTSTRRAGTSGQGPGRVVGAAAAVVGLLVVASAAGGTWELGEPRIDLGGEVAPPEVTLPPPAPGEGGLAERPPPEPAMDLAWLAPFVEVVALAVGAAIVVGVLWWVWVRARDRDVSRLRPVGTGGDAAVATEPELPVLRRGVAEAQRFLAGIDRPADAVIAAWLALEEAAEASGVGRNPAQTPTELTVAVLERTEADPDATTELLALYHRARFSRHPIGPAEVADASRCLAALAARWDALATAGRRGR